jgi:hypothetical protein
MADLDDRKKQMQLLRRQVEKSDKFEPGSEELDRLLDRIREQGYELRKRGESSARHTELQEFEERAAELIELAKEIRDAKNPEYGVGSGDYHASLRKIAADTDVSVDEACYLLWKKHLLAIANNAVGTDVDASEDMDERFADALNFLLFQFSLYRERSND